MKIPFLNVFTVILGLSTVSAFASEAVVYCRNVDGPPIDVTSDQGYECVRELLGEDTENACFTGKRGAAIEILNSLATTGVFDGTDGEYIKAANFKGRDAISYTSVDEANGWSRKSTLSRCEASFFPE